MGSMRTKCGRNQHPIAANPPDHLGYCFHSLRRPRRLRHRHPRAAPEGHGRAAGAVRGGLAPLGRRCPRHCRWRVPELASTAATEMRGRLTEHQREILEILIAATAPQAMGEVDEAKERELFVAEAHRRGYYNRPFDERETFDWFQRGIRSRLAAQQAQPPAAQQAQRQEVVGVPQWVRDAVHNLVALARPYMRDDVQMAVLADGISARDWLAGTGCALAVPEKLTQPPARALDAFCYVNGWSDCDSYIKPNNR